MHKLKAGSDPGLFFFFLAVHTSYSAVIAREGGRSSTPRLLGSLAGAGGYWMPRLRGAWRREMKMTEAMPAPFFRHSGAREARTRNPSCDRLCGPMDSGPAPVGASRT